MSEENIVRFSLDDLDERLRSGLVVMDAERVNNMTEDEIERLAIEENERLGFSDDWYEKILVPSAGFGLFRAD